MASKTVATFVTFPYQLIKVSWFGFSQMEPFADAQRAQARMQVRELHFQRDASFLRTIATVWRADGFKGFYRGVFPASLRAAPHAALMFYGYEWTRSMISNTKL